MLAEYMPRTGTTIQQMLPAILSFAPDIMEAMETECTLSALEGAQIT